MFGKEPAEVALQREARVDFEWKSPRCSRGCSLREVCGELPAGLGPRPELQSL